MILLEVQTDMLIDTLGDFFPQYSQTRMYRMSVAAYCWGALGARSVNMTIAQLVRHREDIDTGTRTMARFTTGGIGMECRGAACVRCRRDSLYCTAFVYCRTVVVPSCGEFRWRDQGLVLSFRSSEVPGVVGLPVRLAVVRVRQGSASTCTL